MAVKELFAQLHEVAAAPKKQLEKYLAEGKKVVAVAPVYTPQEIIHSMGMVPMGVWGADMELNESKKYYPAFICSIMQSILELGLKGEYDGVSAIIIPSLCDSLKTLGQNWKYAVKDIPFIPMTYPQNRKLYYKQFMKALGREDLIDDERYFPIQNLQAKGLGTEMYDICMEAMSKKTAAEWQPILKEADVAFSLAQSWSEILEDEQAWANNCLYKMQYDNGNTRTLVRPPVKFQEMGVPEYKGGPLIGEQGPEILKDLGYTDEQIQEYQEKGILFVWKDDRK